jgi:hypothetical protein
LAKTNQVVKALKAALGKFQSGKRWTKGTNARDKNGNAVGERTRLAHSFCAIGAVNSVLRPTDYDFDYKVRRRLIAAIPKTARCSSITAYNDAPGRTFAQIKAWFQTAIKQEAA